MSVGVRELKAKLSEYLRRVEAGEVITVTEHGRPKAIISPVAGGSRYERGVAEGWITPATPETFRALDVMGACTNGRSCLQWENYTDVVVTRRPYP